YALAFALDGRAPRVIVTSEELAVPLVVANTGTRAWDAASIHLSYHWVWLIPRELPHRSRWDLPYHEGIRTGLPISVAPGARVSVDGRLLAPAVPGAYWLQWDMVEEGVAWFSQGSPRQHRQLVVVVPTAATLFAPLPLIVALAGLFALRRAEQAQRRWAEHAQRLPTTSGTVEGGAAPPRRMIAFVTIADAAWCASTL